MLLQPAPPGPSDAIHLVVQYVDFSQKCIFKILGTSGTTTKISTLSESIRQADLKF